MGEVKYKTQTHVIHINRKAEKNAIHVCVDMACNMASKHMGRKRAKLTLYRSKWKAKKIE